MVAGEDEGYKIYKFLDDGIVCGLTAAGEEGSLK